MLESGYRISDLDNIPVNGEKCIEKNRIAFDKTYLLGYAHSVYGITYNTHNYKVPLSSLRDDLKGYIGIESVSPKWSGQIKLWAGKWEDKENENNSYTKVWNTTDGGNPYYNPEKFQDIEDTFYIIKDAPYPFEEKSLHNRNNGEALSEIDNDGNEMRVNRTLKAQDPYPDSHKIVTKKYIDERLAAKRLVEVGSTFRLRDYDCSYLIPETTMAKTNTIKIVYSDAFVNRIKHNTLEFTLLLEGKKVNGLYEPANTSKITLVLVKENGEAIPFYFLEGLEPDWTNKNLYSNSRYLYLKFRTSTEKLNYTSTTKTIEGVENQNGEKISVPGEPNIIPKFEVSIICENSIYKRNSNVITISNKDGWITPTGGGNNWTLVFNSNKLPVSKTYSVKGDNKWISATPKTSNNNTEYTLAFDETKLPAPIELSAGTLIRVTETNNGYRIDYTGKDGADVVMPEVKEYDITSSNESIIIPDPTISGNTTTYDLTVDTTKLPKVEIKEGNKTWFLTHTTKTNNNITTYTLNLNDALQLYKTHEIDFNNLQSAYYIEGENISLTFKGTLSNDKIKIIHLYYRCGDADSSSSNTFSIDSDDGAFGWSMNNVSPKFTINKLYAIELTCLPANYGKTTPQYIARVIWFKDL